MTNFAPTFTILADTKDGEAKETRCKAASAMCLAEDWVEAGYKNVRIVDREGLAHSPESFRARLPLRKLIMQRQREMRAL
jgi:hypothetical protein